MLFTFQITNKQIDSLQNFKTEKWNKIPGTSLTFNAYYNSILVIFQKIRLVGKGDYFKSLAVNNEEGVKTLMTSTQNPITKIDLNNFIARKINLGENKFYMAYKSNFEIIKNDENTILNYVMEFPFIENLEILNTEFNPKLISNEISSKNIYSHDKE